MSEFWLDLNEQLKLKELRDTESSIHEKHIKRIKAHREGKLEKEEIKQWHEDNKRLADVQKEIKSLMDKNPLRPENLVKKFKDWDPNN